MKRGFAYAAAVAALLTAGGVQAGPGFDLDGDLALMDLEPVDMEMVRHPNGTLTTRETFMQPDGSVITRTTVREPSAMPPAQGVAVELTPAQRQLIWHAVAVPGVNAHAGEEMPQELMELPPPLVREHIEAAPAPRLYRIGTRIPVPSALQPLPDSVTVAVPSVQDHLYAVVDQRVLLVEPVTNTVVAEVVR